MARLLLTRHDFLFGRNPFSILPATRLTGKTQNNYLINPLATLASRNPRFVLFWDVQIFNNTFSCAFHLTAKMQNNNRNNPLALSPSRQPRSTLVWNMRISNSTINCPFHWEIYGCGFDEEPWKALTSARTGSQMTAVVLRAHPSLSRLPFPSLSSPYQSIPQP